MSPQTGSRRYTHTHLKWFMGTLVFSTLHCRDFSFFFYFFFLRTHKKHKNANKRISDFFPLRCFLSAFLIFFLLICVFVLFATFWCFLVLFGAFGVSWCFFCAFLCFFVRVKSFRKKIIKSLKLS